MAAAMDAVWLRRIKAPGAETIAILFFLEALSRGTVSAVLPIDTVSLLGSDEALSLCILAGSVVAVPTVLLAPALARRFGRPGLLSVACAGGLAAALTFTAEIASAQVLAFILRAQAVAVISICLNLFILDYVRRGDLGKSEPIRMMMLGMGWIIGPFLGVQLSIHISPDAPYYFSGAVMLTLLAVFWALRFKEAPGVRRTRNRRFANPLANMSGFLSTPRLLHSWLNSTGRAIFWMSFFYYTPVYAVQTGLDRNAAGLLLSIGTFGMLLMPLWGALTRKVGIRRVATLAFGMAALGCMAAWWYAASPWVGAAGILAAALAMAVNDGYGNSIFFRACRPSQRNEMTPTFTTYRDAAEIGQAATFAILLAFLPIETVFLVLAVLMASLSLLSRTLHPRL